MDHHVRSIRPFVGVKNFDLSRNFYRDLGFSENILSAQLSVFHLGKLSFYLQNAYVKDWVDNTMIFMEVENAGEFYDYLLSLDLPSSYPGTKLVPIRVENWGRECFLHDPSGVLWHFGEFF